MKTKKRMKAFRLHYPSQYDENIHIYNFSKISKSFKDITSCIERIWVEERCGVYSIYIKAFLGNKLEVAYNDKLSFKSEALAKLYAESLRKILKVK